MLNELRDLILISTHAPRAGSDHVAPLPGTAFGISTHAPRAGSDVPSRSFLSDGMISTHAPRAGSDGPRGLVGLAVPISTHAPRAGSDSTCRRPTPTRPYFNPRSPCGERLTQAEIVERTGKFQPTLPVRGATAVRRLVQQHPVQISTHAPRAGSDASTPPTTPRWSNFNPRSPCGERHRKHCPGQGRIYFNPRSPCGERPSPPR